MTAIVWFILIFFLYGVITLVFKLSKLVTPREKPIVTMDVLVDVLLSKGYVFPLDSDKHSPEPVYVRDRAVSELLRSLSTTPRFNWLLRESGFIVVQPDASMPSHIRRYSSVLVTQSNYFIGFNAQ